MVVAGQPALAKQTPAWQTWFAAQVTPQAPQWASSLWISTQTPLQLVMPAGQVHDPSWQVPPLGEAQGVPARKGSQAPALHFFRPCFFLHLPGLQVAHSEHAG